MPWTKDPVRPSDRAEVFERDGQCIAPLVDPNAGPCQSRWGRTCNANDRRAFTLDHVPPAPGSTRVSRPRWMVTLCWGHGVITHWETAHRADERDYLRRIYGAEEEARHDDDG